MQQPYAVVCNFQLSIYNPEVKGEMKLINNNKKSLQPLPTSPFPDHCWIYFNILTITLFPIPPFLPSDTLRESQLDRLEDDSHLRG